MQKLSSIIIFYRPFFLWSFAVNILLTVFNPKIIPAISIKLILVIFLWFILSRVNGGKVINLYKDVGISTFKLFGSIFLIDILITLVYLLVIKEFI